MQVSCGESDGVLHLGSLCELHGNMIPSNARWTTYIHLCIHPGDSTASRLVARYILSKWVEPI